jgi:hypothetical protein
MSGGEFVVAWFRSRVYVCVGLNRQHAFPPPWSSRERLTRTYTHSTLT